MNYEILRNRGKLTISSSTWMLGHWSSKKDFHTWSAFRLGWKQDRALFSVKSAALWKCTWLRHRRRKRTSTRMFCLEWRWRERFWLSRTLIRNWPKDGGWPTVVSSRPIYSSRTHVRHMLLFGVAIYPAIVDDDAAMYRRVRGTRYSAKIGVNGLP